MNSGVLAKLPISIRAQFTYFLTDEDITTDLLYWIQCARVSGSSDQIKQILSKYQYTWINPIAAAAQDEPLQSALPQ